jgi:putative transposase
VVLPPWCRKSPRVAEVLPLLSLHGLSTGDFVPALEAFFGSGAGLSAAAVGRLLAAWQADHQAFCQRDLTEREYVYVWADGVVRHEAPCDRVGWKDPPAVCRSRPLKLRAA